MKRIACKIVDSEVKTRFIETCDSCGKTLVDEDSNPDKYEYYRLTGGVVSYDADRDIRYKVENSWNLDICEDCMNALDFAISETMKLLKNKREKSERAAEFDNAVV